MIKYFIKIALTSFVIILVPTYAKYYGFQNFFWISDIGLFLTVLGFWLESSLIISIILLAVLPAEILWNIDFGIHFVSGKKFLGITHYMFDLQYPLFLRVFSLFHIILPIIWIWYVVQHGYNKRAFLFATILLWCTLLATYLFTQSQKNINWVFSPEFYQWETPAWSWLAIMMVSIPLFIYLPIHRLFLRLFRTRK